jgi:hypothetical protein
MTRASRLALYALLVLMQILAPWVHAHTGRETGGFLHLPGLESLAGSGKGYAVADLQAGTADVIVGVQAGVPGDGQDAQFSPDGHHDQPILLPALFALTPPPRFAGRCARVETPRPRFRFSRHDFAPRAPPLRPLRS